MGYDNDALYKSTPNALGAPTQVFVDFFDQQGQTPLRVLDVGCGQGRDALFIARAGHEVVGVDLSPCGIAALQKTARKEGLNITGFASDITDFEPEGQFDVLPIDPTRHMLPEAARLAVLVRLIKHVALNRWVLIADETANMKGFKTVFANSAYIWQTTLDTGSTLFMQRV